MLGFTSGKLLGSSYVLATINATYQTRDSSQTSFLQSQMENYNLMIYTTTLAKQVLFDSSKKATGVVVDSAGLSYTISANKEVIVSAGAFQSPQLLMVSGVGPKDTLDKYNIPVVSELSGVGQNMWVSIRLPSNMLSLADLFLGPYSHGPIVPIQRNHDVFTQRSRLLARVRGCLQQQSIWHPDKYTGRLPR